MKTNERILWIFLVCLVVLIMMFDRAGRYTRAEGDIYDNLNLFNTVLSIIRNDYVDKTDSQKLIYGAIDGMLGSLNDPYTRFMRPEAYKEMKVETKGKFGGVGIYITIREGWLTVIAPIEGTPAYKAGIQPNDRIVKIDGETTQDITINDAMNKLRGDRGTKVTVTIQREGEKEPFDIVIVRDIIKIKNVLSRIIEDKKIGYIRIKNFMGEETFSELESILKEFDKSHLKGCVIDLRYNPGGLLLLSWKIADLFLTDGKIVYTRGRIQEQNQDYMADPKDYLHNVPLVILVNEGSASASEIVTGALKDNKRAVIVGTKTFGKGVVQTIRELDDNVALSITTARYYTPSGVCIQDKGIQPDITVDFPKPTDLQITAIKKIISTNYIPEFIKAQPRFNNQDIENFDKRLKDKNLDIPIDFLRRLIKNEANKDRELVLDLEDDVQLKRAVEVINASDILK